MAILKIKQPDGSWAIVGDTSETIKFTEQQLTPDQKEIARENIDAINYAALPIQHVTELPDGSEADPEVFYHLWDLKLYANYGMDLTGSDLYTIRIVKTLPEIGLPAVTGYGNNDYNEKYNVYHDLSTSMSMGYIDEALYQFLSHPFEGPGWYPFPMIDYYLDGDLGFQGYIPNNPSAYHEYCYTLNFNKIAHYSPQGWQYYSFIRTGSVTGAEVFNDIVNNAAISEYAHAEGTKTSATATAAHAEGKGTIASGFYAHAEGESCTASGYSSHAEGENTQATKTYAHAEGYQTKATESASHAEGESTTASAKAAHAEGYRSKASGFVSHAEGYYTQSTGYYSHAEGEDTQAIGRGQHVQGAYNIIDTSTSISTRATYAHIVGNGTSSSKRSNAHTLGWDGTAWFAGDVYIGSTSGTNKDEGSKKLATEDQVATKTSVTVGGVHQEAFDADTKLDKLGPPPYAGQTRVYTQDPNGNVSGKTIAINEGLASPNAVTCYLGDGAGTTVPSGYLVCSTPKKPGHATNKQYVDTNFVSKDAQGNVSIAGNLTVQGTTYTQDNETLRIADNIIELNSTKVDNSTTLSGIAINKNENSTYGIMYDPTDDTVKFGEGTTNNGAFSFRENEGAPLAVRDDSSELDDGTIMIFDKSKNRLVKSGYTIDSFKQWVKDYIESYMSTEIIVENNKAGGETLEVNTDNYTEENGVLTIGG